MSTVQERPILMSAPMVRAILEGCKTQTRRVFKDAWQIHPFEKPWYVREALEKCPYGVPGGRLWVKETWFQGYATVYRADHPDCPPSGDPHDKWRSPIFMPRWASRITLEITDVRVQRLQDISEEDAEAEGIDDRDALVGQVTNPFITAYAVLWDSIYGKSHPWSDNPWVWAIAFKRLEK